MSQEILINASRVSNDRYVDLYEFVIDEDLKIVECVYIESLADGLISPIPDYSNKLSGILFELNHVRVNPRVDNTIIIKKLTDALNAIDVHVANTPAQDSMAVCFKPLGEISDNVRFYFGADGKFIFLSPAIRPKVVHNNIHSNTLRFN